MPAPYRLHYAPDNASLVVRLALEELGQPYETALVDRARGAQKSPAYRALNPSGLIPVLETPQGAIFETAAILLWLADRHGALAPAPDAPERGDFLKWLFFASNTLHAGLRMLFHPAPFVGEDAAAGQALRDNMGAALAAHWGHLEAAAATRPPWLGAASPSALDFYLAPLLRWSALYPVGGTGWFRSADYPHLRAMASGIEARPAAAAAIAAEGLGPLPFTAPRIATPPEGSAT
ncbi:glutathione S-transferase family protein [Rhodosalinus sp. FB01]|uniref:glutathione S-transferase family protein n=1 Tax=Rhodosalinus sp. FB01 TaxID=3239194 RepID=UPI003526740E